MTVAVVVPVAAEAVDAATLIRGCRTHLPAWRFVCEEKPGWDRVEVQALIRVIPQSTMVTCRMTRCCMLLLRFARA